MAANKEIVKDCRSAIQLEQELQISYAQRGVAILDVYSSEWGPCRAIAETFRRLLTDQGDGVHLRFLSVECNAILASLKSPDEQKNPQRPKNLEAIRDTLPEGWQHILEERCGQSKPFFLFYKEGKRVSQIEGVNTPLIRATVKDLCSVKTPASEFISNARLQEFWDEQFNPEESDVAYDKFLKGLLAALKYTVPLNDAEKATLGEAVGLTKERMVTAEGLQKWIGDDEVRTVHQAFIDTLPDYEARAAAQSAKDEEERKAREAAEALKKAEEEKERHAAEAKKKEEDEEQARRAQAAKENHNKGGGDYDALVEKLQPEGIHSQAEATEGAEEKEIRHAVESAAAPKAVSNRFGAKFVPATEAEEAAAALNESVTANSRSLKTVLRESGLSFKAIAALRQEASEKVGHEGLPPLARLALFLLAADEQLSNKAIKKPLDFAEAVSAQTALSAGGLLSDVAFSAISTAVTAAPKDTEFTVSTTTEIVKTLLTTLGGEVALAPLTLLCPDSDSEDRVTVTLTGIPMTVQLWSASPTVHALHWFTKFSISAINPLTGSVTLAYAGLVGDDAFTMKAASLSTESNEDERRFAALQELQALPAEAAQRKKTPEDDDAQPAGDAADDEKQPATSSGSAGGAAGDNDDADAAEGDHPPTHEEGKAKEQEQEQQQEQQQQEEADNGAKNGGTEDDPSSAANEAAADEKPEEGGEPTPPDAGTEEL